MDTSWHGYRSKERRQNICQVESRYFIGKKFEMIMYSLYYSRGPCLNVKMLSFLQAPALFPKMLQM